MVPYRYRTVPYNTLKMVEYVEYNRTVPYCTVRKYLIRIKWHHNKSLQIYPKREQYISKKKISKNISLKQ